MHPTRGSPSSPFPSTSMAVFASASLSDSEVVGLKACGAYNVDGSLELDLPRICFSLLLVSFEPLKTPPVFGPATICPAVRDCNKVSPCESSRLSTTWHCPPC